MGNPGDGLKRLQEAIILGLNGPDRKRCSSRPDFSPGDPGNDRRGQHRHASYFPGNRSPFIGGFPFPPAAHHSQNIKARELGLKIHPAAYVHVLPIEAGFVGADNVGVLISEPLTKRMKWP